MIIILSAKNRRTPRRDVSELSPSILVFWLFLLFLLGYFLKSPRLAAESVRSGLEICASGLIPSLFPFIVLIGMINAGGIPELLSRMLGRGAAALFRVSAVSVYPMLIGAVGGFPMGAVSVRRLYDDGSIDRDEAERLLAFSGNASPAFCIGAVGIAMFGDGRFGVRLYICQLVSAVIIALATRGKGRPGKAIMGKRQTQSVFEAVVDSISAGGLTMLKICSFAVFFAVVGDSLCMAVSRYFGEGASAVCASLTELTLASRKCAAADGVFSRILCAFSVGWSGMSVHMQTASVLSGSGLGLRKYIFGKAVQGMLTALLMSVILWLYGI